MANKTVQRKRGRVTVDGHPIPVTVFFERRDNARQHIAAAARRHAGIAVEVHVNSLAIADQRATSLE